MLNPII